MTTHDEPRALADLARVLETAWMDYCFSDDADAPQRLTHCIDAAVEAMRLWQAPPSPDAGAFADAVDALIDSCFSHDAAEQDRYRERRAALLAFAPSGVRITEVIEAARGVVDSADADVLFGHDLTDEERRLKAALSALNGGAHE